MNNAKWTWFAIGYQCGLLYCHRSDDQPVWQGLSPVNMNILGLIVAVAALVLMVYMLVRPSKGSHQATEKVRVIRFPIQKGADLLCLHGSPIIWAPFS